MCLFFECRQYFLLIFICPTILVTCTAECCVYREFSLLEKLFGLLFWKNNYTKVSNTDINIGDDYSCSNVGSGEICLSRTHCIKDYLGFFLYAQEGL